METIKLYKVEGISGKFRPDVSYITATSEKKARHAYSHYDLGGNEYFNFIVISELEPTYENKMAIIYNIFLTSDLYKHNVDYLFKSGRDLDNIWNSHRGYWKCEIDIKHVFNFERLRNKVWNVLLKKKEEIQKNIESSILNMKRIDDNLIKLGYRQKVREDILEKIGI